MKLLTMKFLKTKLLKIALALCVLAGLAAAEDKLPARFVRVTGTSEVKVVPDRAVIEVGVEKQRPQRQRGQACRRCRGARDTGGAARQWDRRQGHSDHVSSRSGRIPPTQKGVRTDFFVAAQTMTITVRDIAKLDALLEALVKAGGNRIGSIGYETSDLRKYRDQARDMAVKAAREKAGALAKALGQDIGKAQSIEEVPESDYSVWPMHYADLKIGRRAGCGATLAPGQKTISASVAVSFELN